LARLQPVYAPRMEFSGVTIVRDEIAGRC
jgi:hypothetical protein